MIAAYFLLNGNEVTVVLMMVSFRVLYKIGHKRFTGKTPFAVGLRYAAKMLEGMDHTGKKNRLLHRSRELDIAAP